jgi:SAM-dependent methyltransferase
MPTPHEHNRRAWDALAQRGQAFTLPATADQFADPLGNLDPRGWLEGSIAGKRVLCLAAGGGKHGPLYAAAGASVTVLDISPAMLERDHEVARRQGLTLRIAAGSMDDLSQFTLGEFDIVIHPVSTCYVPNIASVYEAVARVTAPGGLYVSQHKTPTSLQTSIAPGPQGYIVKEPYFRQGPLSQVQGTLLREEGTWEYLHRWEELLGSLCRAGFSIEDLAEPRHADPSAEQGSFGHRCCYVAPYVRVKARRRPSASTHVPTPQIILPS